MFSVELTEAAAEFYRKSDKPLAKKIARCFQQLEQEPRHHGNVKPLRGKLSGQYRYRVGNHRVIYTIDDKAQVVYVLKIAHRSSVYE